jgi:hypothetical protein
MSNKTLLSHLEKVFGKDFVETMKEKREEFEVANRNRERSRKIKNDF